MMKLIILLLISCQIGLSFIRNSFQSFYSHSFYPKLNTINNNKDNEVLPNIYSGAVLDELGLIVTISDSLFTNGKGLFLSLADDEIDNVNINAGQILCGYAKGRYHHYTTS